MVYFDFLLRNILHILHSVRNTYKGRFLEDCFYCYSQQIIPSVANESLIPYNLTKRVTETQNLYTEPLILPQTKSSKCCIQLSFLNKRYCATQI